MPEATEDQQVLEVKEVLRLALMGMVQALVPVPVVDKLKLEGALE